MKKITILFSILFLALSSCGVKTTQSMLSDGNYDGAIDRAVEALRTKKDSKGKQDYVYLLEEAFAKAKDRDLRSLELMIKEANPVNAERTYNTYMQLNNRQEKIRPLLPLQLLKQGRTATFQFDNYTNQIISSKIALTRYLYENASALLKSNNKLDFRKAYDDFSYLESISPNYKNTKKLMEDAQFKGTDFVDVYAKNETNMVIPKPLQDDLLDFKTYGLNDKWTVYHSLRQKGIVYDYSLIVNFVQINISPEQIKEKEFIKERQIKDGVKTLLDSRGRPVKDSLGREIKVDNYRMLRANVYEFRQFKSCQITAKVDYVDLKTNQLLQSFPVSSEFIFENIYSTYKGDRSACEDNYISYFNKRAVPFPNNEQMVFDTGEDLKERLKDIIVRNKFRR
ncbi:hypothetical protein [Flavobacterium tructae]|uniref:Lipoprotein n=1 Tax=Flavobacterium tructae TaxID=1114873 RepID=A0A1S1J8I0_9FLAO|nr:hypothetical protein [Flavobacterium tructae]MDL2141805.1 hypothetical protein [Flavobacterium tructae]OHT45799.1 hypothetical protein BHE19_08195 [Flavobacterium tructae]OXB17060.1 hypothetical protein B0A71_17480 [Flavobacterium tructae]OXB22673.1 hypothetical protein B0A80_15355 [Flavobacterium tructae]